MIDKTLEVIAQIFAVVVGIAIAIGLCLAMIFFYILVNPLAWIIGLLIFIIVKIT